MKLQPCFSSDSCEAEIGLAKCFYSVIRSMSRCSNFSYEWGNGLIFRPSPGCLRTAYSKTIWMTVFSWGSTDVICEEKWKETKGFAFDTVSIFNLRILACCCLKAWLNWEILLHTQVFLSLTMWEVNVADSNCASTRENVLYFIQSWKHSSFNFLAARLAFKTLFPALWKLKRRLCFLSNVS